MSVIPGTSAGAAARMTGEGMARDLESCVPNDSRTTTHVITRVRHSYPVRTVITLMWYMASRVRVCACASNDNMIRREIYSRPDLQRYLSLRVKLREPGNPKIQLSVSLLTLDVMAADISAH